MQVLWTRRQVYHDDDDDDDVDDNHDDSVEDDGCDDEYVPHRCPYFIDPASNDLTGRVIDQDDLCC